MKQIFLKTLKWIKSDYTDHPFRFFLEVLAWVMSLSCAITMALTIPYPPFYILYPVFMAQCGIFAWSAWTRKSFGMLSNYMLLLTIDATGYLRLLLL